MLLHVMTPAESVCSAASLVCAHERRAKTNTSSWQDRKVLKMTTVVGGGVYCHSQHICFMENYRVSVWVGMRNRIILYVCVAYTYTHTHTRIYIYIVDGSISLWIVGWIKNTEYLLLSCIFYPFVHEECNFSKDRQGQREEEGYIWNTFWRSFSRVKLLSHRSVLRFNKHV